MFHFGCPFCCYSQRKVKNSESKSQQAMQSKFMEGVVIHSVKLKILKANHNDILVFLLLIIVVIHSVKLKILKANHNTAEVSGKVREVVIHSVKLKILKANHNR